MKNIIIATIKEWNISNYFKLKELYKEKYTFYLITIKDELIKEYIEELNPEYIFFLHWSWIIPKNIYNNFECVVFHMTDLPYGRGGSPLQNLLIRGIYRTKISAIKVSEVVDSGRIYIKEDFNIEQGSAKEIFTRASEITFNKLIPKFLNNKLKSSKQVGEIITFQRRTPRQSDINTLENISLHKMYDFIRMLDADGYPKAFLKFDKIKIEFSEVLKEDGKLIGTFEVIDNE